MFAGNVLFDGSVLCSGVLFLNGNVYPEEDENLEVWMDKTAHSLPSFYGSKLWWYVWLWSTYRKDSSKA